MIDIKKIRPILNPKNRGAKDPVRFPKVILGFEGQSKRDFATYLQMETKMLIKEVTR